ncbi:hypothetical protein [Cupriavidus pinatubonensis]|uniref:hypothetical protein n=1 Tax=Cupriavidus pinatubonensis TaxID=248026 RepID=UPI002159C747|nr:hypothetical protein [Cupriavidus pinatubonensis]
MRTLLYFSLRDTATARLAKVRLGDFAGTQALVAGPWFVQRDNQPVDGLPTIDVGQTTYREEAAITGIFVGALVGALVIFRYGASAGAGATAIAYVGAVMLGAMIGWWVCGLVGGKIVRLALWRRNAQLVTITQVSTGMGSRRRLPAVIQHFASAPHAATALALSSARDAIDGMSTFVKAR